MLTQDQTRSFAEAYAAAVVGAAQLQQPHSVAFDAAAAQFVPYAIEDGIAGDDVAVFLSPEGARDLLASYGLGSVVPTTAAAVFAALREDPRAWLLCEQLATATASGDY